MSEEMNTQPTSGAELRNKARTLVTNPETGNTFLLRRPSIPQLVAVNVLPENYVGKALANEKTEGESGDGEAPDDGFTTDAEILSGDAIRRAYVLASCLKPRIVKNPTADDECEYEDLLPSDRIFIHNWAAGFQKVEAEGGELDGESLHTFSGSERTAAGADVPLPAPEPGERVGAV